MILVPKRRIWTRQPQQLTGFDTWFPRPAFAFNAALGVIEIAGRGVGVKASTDSFRPTSQGIAYKVARATDGGLDFGTYQPLTSDAFTVIVLANGQSADGAGSLFSQRAGSSPYNQIGLALNQANDASGRAGGFNCLSVDTSASTGPSSWRSTHSNSTSVVDGKFHVFGATKAGASSLPILWYDGASIATTTYSVGTFTTAVAAPQKTRIGNLADFGSGNGGDGSICSSSDIALVLAFNGALSDAQMRALTEALLAPYRIFQPIQRRIWVPTGGAAFSLSAAAGTYSVSGQSAALNAARNIGATAGSYSITGQTSGLKYGRTLPAGAGTYSTAGAAAALSAARKIGAAAGSYAVAGLDATLKTAHVLSAGVGGYVVAGQSAVLKIAYRLPAVSGTYAISGQSANLALGLKIQAGVGAYSYTGAPASLLSTRTLAPAAGNYVIAGQPAALNYGTAAKVLFANAGAFTISGQSAILAKATKWTADAGAYVISGASAALAKATRPTTSAGAYAVSGATARLRISRIVAADAGSYTIIGNAAALSVRLAQAWLSADAGVFSVSGQNATLKAVRRMPGSAGVYSITGQPSVLKRGIALGAGAGSYGITGQPTTFAYYRRLVAAPGGYLISGQAAALNRTTVVSAFVHGNRRVFEMDRRKRSVRIPR